MIEIARAFVVVALGSWGWHASPAVTVTSEASPATYNATALADSYPTADGCTVRLFPPFSAAPAGIQWRVVLHEVTHCLFFQYGFYDHLPWEGASSGMGAVVTDSDRAALAAYARRAQSAHVVRIAGLAVGE